jgi:hypothetical protein
LALKSIIFIFLSKILNVLYFLFDFLARFLSKKRKPSLLFFRLTFFFFHFLEAFHLGGACFDQGSGLEGEIFDVLIGRERFVEVYI